MEHRDDGAAAAAAAQAQSLLSLRALLGESAFLDAKTKLLASAKTTEVLAALMEVPGFLDSSDIARLSGKAASAAAAEPKGKLLDSGLDVTTALCLIVNGVSNDNAIQSVRQAYDAAFERWPPHINFFFPFLPVSQFPELEDRIGRAIETFGPFELVLDKPSFFSQGKGKVTFNLQASDESKLQQLYDVVKKSLPEDFPEPKKAFHPHLTLGQCQKDELDAILAKNPIGPVRIRVDHLSMIARFGKEPFQVMHKLPLEPVANRPKFAAPVPVAAPVAAVARQVAFAAPVPNDNNAVVVPAAKGRTEPILQLWSESGAQLLLLPTCASPNPNTVPFYAVADMKEAGVEVETEQFVMILLDCSSSMNCDAAGVYQAPDSPDHPDSPIAKARRVCSELAASSFVGGAKTVVVVPWFDRVSKPIKLEASEFLDRNNAEEFVADLAAKILAKLGENAFRAGGATNLEAVLDFACNAIKTQAGKKGNRCSFGVWLLTDGEPTLFSDPHTGVAEYIVSNPNDPKFGYFNKRDNHLTQYEQFLCRKMRQNAEAVRAMGTCESEWHFVAFGEAEANLMLAIADSCGGAMHPVRQDLNVLLAEFKAGFKAASSKVEASIDGFAVNAQMVADGTLHSRGFLSSEVAKSVARSGVATLAVGKRSFRLAGMETLQLEVETLENIRSLLGLEAELVGLMQRMEDLGFAGTRLKELRARRLALVALLSRSLRFQMLQALLETYLDSLISAELAFQRLLAQYLLKNEASDLSQVADRLEMLNDREKKALAAGVSSLKTGMGFAVQKRYDRQISKIVASKGAWARKMLSRAVVLHRTEDEAKNEARVWLYVLEQASVQTQRAKFCSSHKNLEGLWEEELCVMPEADTLGLRVSVGGVEVGVFAFETVYARFVDNVFVRVSASDLAEAEKQLLDPLSFASFLELIKEQHTLPAALYSIQAIQGPAVLFDAKELLRILPGQRDGADQTSFNYFRLMQRLSGDDDEDEADGGLRSIRIPGTFSEANFALPLAPDPLSSCVLSNLLVGLLSEPITGTALAPLGESGLFYAAFCYHHLRVAKISQLDFLRAMQSLASLHFWIENPKTNPTAKEFEEACQNMFGGAGEISRADSPGHFPVRAFVYGLLCCGGGGRFTKSHVFGRLMKESATRALRLAFEDSKTRADFLRKMVERISGERLLLDEENKGEEAKVPKLFFECAEQLALAVREGKLGAFVARHRDAMAETVASVVSTLPHWVNSLRTLRHWAAVATMAPADDLMRALGAYQTGKVAAMADGCARACMADDEVAWEKVLWIWCHDEDGALCVLSSVAGGGGGGGGLEETILRPNRKGEWKLEQRGGVSEEGSSALESVVACLLGLHSWNGSASNAFGLSPIDFQVVEALRRPELAAQLSATQLAVYAKAKDRREAYKVYFPWVPKKVEAPRLEGELVRADLRGRAAMMGAAGGKERPRLCVCVIGDVDHGKSSLLGRMVWEVGDVPERVMKTIEQQCKELGKEGAKYSWIMDKLREERERGVTIMWKAWTLQGHDTEIDVIDTPGHTSFVKNMTVGASMADLAVVVVSAARGEFEMGWSSQARNTQREILVCAAMGLKSFVFAINKMDLFAKEGEAAERFAEIRDEILHTMGKKYGVPSERCVFVPVSAWMGWNLLEDNVGCPWWNGVTVKDKIGVKSLFGAIEAIGECRSESEELLRAPLRLPLTGAYKIKGVGTVIVGRIMAGQVRVGDEIQVVGMGPNGPAMVRSIEIFHSSRQAARPGDLVGLAVTLIYSKVERGMVVVCRKEGTMAGTTCVVAQLRLMPKCGVMKVGFRPYAFLCTASFPVIVEALLTKQDKATGKEEQNPREARPGDTVTVRLIMEAPIAAEPYPSIFGRFLLRDGPETIALGRIMKIEAQQQVAKVPLVKKKGKHFK